MNVVVALQKLKKCSPKLAIKKWLLLGIGLQLSVGYTLGFAVSFFGNIISGEGFVSAWMPILGWSIVAVIAAGIALLAVHSRVKERKA